MAQVLERAEGETTQIPLEIKNTDLSVFASIELRIERQGFTLAVLSVVVDDGPNGLGHFSPSAAQITPGKHLMRIKTVTIATSEISFFPKLPTFFLEVGRTLADQT